MFCKYFPQDKLGNASPLVEAQLQNIFAQHTFAQPSEKELFKQCLNYYLGKMLLINANLWLENGQNNMEFNLSLLWIPDQSIYACYDSAILSSQPISVT